jgi:hypothetical protein
VQKSTLGVIIIAAGLILLGLGIAQHAIQAVHILHLALILDAIGILLLAAGLSFLLFGKS